MKKWQIVVVAVALFVAAGLLMFETEQAAAHERRGVGEYNLVFGWRVEPAYAGVYNGPEVRIMDIETEEPVVGAEKTLKLEVTFGGKSKQLALRPAWNDPGHYLAYLTPTRPGDYSFELTGTISGTNAITPTVINEVFTSADGEFGTVEPSTDVLFPDTAYDVASLQQQLDQLRTELEALKEEMAAMHADMQ
ncbi:MAG: hypothetical protein IT329_07335 [Caldilineaceae bacterium]|nr:hypothetical protein [Caldilineaceae bacterium]